MGVPVQNRGDQRPGAQMQQPLAIAVIGGLLANMLFTRLVIPVGYVLLERMRPAVS